MQGSLYEESFTKRSLQGISRPPHERGATFPRDGQRDALFLPRTVAVARILILYGTTDGHTAKVAAGLAVACRDAGAAPTVVNAADARTVRPDDFDRVVVAASVHIGGYQGAVGRWVRRHRDALNARPSAFVSVCLAILQPEAKPQREARAIAARFLARTGWRPQEVKLVAGATPFTRYGWAKALVMRRIAARVGAGADRHRDYVYTDWDDLHLFGRRFAETHPAPLADREGPRAV